MADKTKPGGDAPPHVNPLAPLLLTWQAAGLGPLNWLAPTVIERMSDMGAEWFTFVAGRVREDVALQHALLHAKSASDAQEIQLKFLQRALDQYTAETGKLVEQGSKLFEPVEDDENLNV